MRNKTIRILAWGGIGDVLFLTPSLRALRQASPGARIMVLYKSRHQRECLLNNPHIDVLRPLLSLQSLPLAGIWVLRRLRRNMFRLDKPVIEAAWGHARASFLHPIPATDVVAEMLGVSLVDRRLEIFLTPSEEDEARTRLRAEGKPVVALHVKGACTPNKDWLAPRWEELVARNPQYTFVQIGGNGDPVVPGADNLLGLPLRLSFAVLRHSQGFVGIESGLSQAAAALGIAGVVLFGASSPQVAGHPGVHSCVSANVGCSPCIDILNWVECPFGRICMDRITVEMVEARLRERVPCPAQETVAVPA